MSMESMKDWLEQWLILSASVDNSTLSLLLHSPIFLAYNHRNNLHLLYKWNNYFCYYLSINIFLFIKLIKDIQYSITYFNLKDIEKKMNKEKQWYIRGKIFINKYTFFIFTWILYSLQNIIFILRICLTEKIIKNNMEE